MIKIFLVMLLFMILSCGKPVKDVTDDESREEVSPDGVYTAIFMPVNGKISNKLYGKIEIRKFGDHFQVNSHLRSGPRGNHRQYLHTGTWCPKLSEDVDGNGYIDGYEARLKAGYIIVPLDGDLSSQFSGGEFVLSGNYSYNRSTSYHLMLSDLHLPDEIVNDPIVKLNEKDLPLERRVVMIYTGFNGKEMPIACGILTRSSDIPSPSDETWETDSRTEEPSPRPRPRPNPRPEPRPEPDPNPPPGPLPDNNDSWWDWMRDRWNRWRRGGGGNPSALNAYDFFSENSV